MLVIRREKRLDLKYNKKHFAYLCGDNVWRHIKGLAEICEIENRTIRQKINTIRNRLQKNKLPCAHILGPSVPRGRRLDGSTTRQTGEPVNGKPNWGGLTQDDRPNDVRQPGIFER